MFQFKQFSIRHDRCAMKVGTDGVLLGAWASVDGRQQVLDVGTGSGLIALMLAQRNPAACIVGIDIDPAAVGQARENKSASPWAERIETLTCDFTAPTELAGRQFDLIVSNPPFFAEQVRSADLSRDKARCADSLPLTALLDSVVAHLSPQGVFSLILPYATASTLIGDAAVRGLYLSRRSDVVTTTGKPPKRTLLEFSRTLVPTSSSGITIYDANHTYTPQFAQLTSPFYL